VGRRLGMISRPSTTNKYSRMDHVNESASLAS
jgi:hypothetical protein